MASGGVASGEEKDVFLLSTYTRYLSDAAGPIAPRLLTLPVDGATGKI